MYTLFLPYAASHTVKNKSPEQLKKKGFKPLQQNVRKINIVLPHIVIFSKY